MPRYGFDPACLDTRPKGMGATFALQVAPILTKVSQEFVPFHPTATNSRIAVVGKPRSASSRRSFKIKSMASDRLLRHSALVLPCPLAPGISGQYATNHFPSRSTTAVNSLCIFSPRFRSQCTMRHTVSQPHFGAERQKSATEVDGATHAQARGVTATGVGCIALLGPFILSFHQSTHHRTINAKTPQPRYSRV